MDMSPTNVGYKFRSPTARKLIAQFQFVVESKQYSLIAGAISPLLLVQSIVCVYNLTNTQTCKTKKYTREDATPQSFSLRRTLFSKSDRSNIQECEKLLKSYARDK